MSRNINILLFAFLTATVVRASNERTCYRDLEDEFQRSYVGLIISPLMSRTTIREIEIYWNHENLRKGDRLALYAEEPRDGLRPIYTLIPSGPSGIQKTGWQAEFVPTSNLSFVGQCLKYHVAWLRNGTIRRTNCLSTRPNWMFEMKDTLDPLTIKRVFLPGTHNSASYVIHKKPRSEMLVEKYVMTQDIDVLAQLIYGVRYLDIRVGYYPDMDIVWWGNHGVIRTVPLNTVIDQVKMFLDNTQEIVIFDVQEFPVGFENDPSAHDKLVAHLEKQFANYFLPKSYGWATNLNAIWSSTKRLIIGYDDKAVVNRHSSVWYRVTHQWGNVRTLQDLYSHLHRIETDSQEKYRSIPRSAMAELTPNTLDVILNRLGSLREMAERVNGNVTKWYNTLWQYTANVVAVDFVRSSGIIETAIEWNGRRNAKC